MTIAIVVCLFLILKGVHKHYNYIEDRLPKITNYFSSQKALQIIPIINKLGLCLLFIVIILSTYFLYIHPIPTDLGEIFFFFALGYIAKKKEK